MSGDWYVLPEAQMEGKWLVDQTRVNLRDLLSERPGAIVRMSDIDAVRYIPPSFASYDHVAGAISDAA